MSRFSALLFAGLIVLTSVGCGSSNRLREVTLNGKNVAVLAAIPPHPRVHAGHPAESAINPYDPVGSAIRVGTSAAKAREAREAQARLDSVVTRVDVAEQIARRVLLESADLLRFVPVGNPDEADYLLDLRIYDYSLVADSYEAATYFALEGEVMLLDPTRGVELWRKKIREREVLSSSLLGLPAAAGNVIT
ncbi:MAG: hypothetical protein R3284_09255, partial [Rubricoccaceae bacterium]|nr:hypothetical protein [Rubricoccaceae bacterium]